MNKFALILFFVSNSLFAQNLSQSFPAGSGATYKILMKSDPTPIKLSLYIAGTRVDSVNVEYFMETEGLFSMQLWQQFEVAVNSSGPAVIKKGYLQSKELPKPEIIPASHLAGAEGGIQVNDFLFSDKKKLEKLKIADETLEIAAGTTKATHYRTSNNGQTVDFWLSDDAKPLGLVMLTSKSDIPSKNYTLELTSLIANVKAKINPENAVSLTEKGKLFLAKPQSLR